MVLKWCLYQEEINQIEMSHGVKMVLYQEEINQTEMSIYGVCIKKKSIKQKKKHLYGYIFYCVIFFINC